MAAKTNKAIYGEDLYVTIGSLGGKAGHTGGFYANRELASIAGAIGGKMSRRGKYKLNREERQEIREAYKELLAVHLETKYRRLPTQESKLISSNRVKQKLGQFNQLYYDWCQRNGYLPSEHAYNTWLEDMRS